jgi:hypothetical protein
LIKGLKMAGQCGLAVKIKGGADGRGNIGHPDLFAVHFVVFVFKMMHEFQKSEFRSQKSVIGDDSCY